MPNIRLGNDEKDSIVAYLLSLKATWLVLRSGIIAKPMTVLPMTCSPICPRS
jgi:hypothetical protein